MCVCSVESGAHEAVPAIRNLFSYLLKPALREERRREDFFGLTTQLDYLRITLSTRVPPEKFSEIREVCFLGRGGGDVRSAVLDWMKFSRGEMSFFSRCLRETRPRWIEREEEEEAATTNSGRQR